MPDKLLTKKCPRCGAQMNSHVEDDEFLEINIKLFKAVICEPCGSFGKSLRRVEDLKAEAWTDLNRLRASLSRLKTARGSGYQIQNISGKIAKLEAEISEIRKGVQSLTEKEQELLNQQSIHEQQLKERNTI